jgi:hypothetical protein
MPHEYAGHYSTKHAAGTPLNGAIAAALEKVAEDGRVTCTAAHQVAESLGVTPVEVGTTADLLELRLVRCQMGLFGYQPEKRIVKPAERISDELRERLHRAAPDGRLSCATCWKLAKELGIGKMDVSAACERLGFKIKPCQIGAF